MRLANTIFVCGIFVFSASIASAQSKQPDDEFAWINSVPDPAKYHWRDTAANLHWSHAAIEALARDKVLLGGREYKQIFEVYTEPRMPMFITTDALLNGYNVLMEETVRRMELTHSGQLRSILQKILANLEQADGSITGNPAMIAEARKRALVTVAVAVALLDGGKSDATLDPAIAPIVAEQVKKVISASGADMPAWLGKPTRDFAGIDYSRFQPRGFYTQSPMLENYFRAVAWLQAIPFHVQEDPEFLAAVMIGRAAGKGPNFAIARFLDSYDALLGQGDNPDMEDMSNALEFRNKIDVTTGDLGELRDAVLRSAKASQHIPVIHDQLQYPAEGDPAVTIRILPARRTPDAVYFEHLLAGAPTSALPTGWNIAAALGSPYARQHVGKTVKIGPLYDRQSVSSGPLYVDYLDCLSALAEPPDKDAPKFMSSPIWQAKTCQTILAGWAQNRHTWQLQAKENFMVLGEYMGPAGFVEPAPDFYGRLADLCDRTAGLLQQAVNQPIDFSTLSGQAHDLIALIAKKDIGPDGQAIAHQLTQTEEIRDSEVLSLILDEAKAEQQLKDLSGELPAIQKLAADFDRGVLPNTPQAERLRTELAANGGVGELWHKLAEICLRLSALSQKELRGVDFTDRENGFITGFGGQLGNVMLYASNSWEIPKDDAPRIADIYRSIQTNEYLEVAIGRPRALYVLYPYHGGEVLCEGAVMPYYEFPHASPMTDAEWMAMLDSKSPPKAMISLP